MVVLDRGFYLLKRDLFTTTDQRLRRHPTEPARAQPEKVLQQHRESLAMAQCFAVRSHFPLCCAFTQAPQLSRDRQSSQCPLRHRYRRTANARDFPRDKDSRAAALHIGIVLHNEGCLDGIVTMRTTQQRR